MRSDVPLCLVLLLAGCANLQLTVDPPACDDAGATIIETETMVAVARPADTITTATINRGLDVAANLRQSPSQVDNLLHKAAAAVERRLGSLHEAAKPQVDGAAIDAGLQARAVVNKFRDVVEPFLVVGTKSQPTVGRQLLAVPASGFLRPSEIENVAKSNGFMILSLHQLGQLPVTPEGRLSLESIEDRARAQELAVANFLDVYLSAYFRHGKFFEASADISNLAKTAATQASNALTIPASVSAADATKIKDALKTELSTQLAQGLAKVCNSKTGQQDQCVLTGSLGDAKFIAKSGLGVQFAGITASFGQSGQLKPSLNYPPATDFGPQIARVAWEAVFDAYGLGPPAVASATACNEPEGKPLYSGLQCLAASDDPRSGKATDTYQDADRVEAAATSIAALWVRGANVAALNNEAIAKSVETSVGVIARKVAERISWVARSCAKPPLSPPTVTAVQ